MYNVKNSSVLYNNAVLPPSHMQVLAFYLHVEHTFMTASLYLLPLLRRFNPAEPVVEKSVIL
jgi:hypothetical protein